MPSLPRLTLLWRKGEAGLPLIDGQTFPEQGGVGSTSFFPHPISVSERGRTVIVIGSPILDDRINPAEAARRLLGTSEMPRTVSRFNGQFLFFVQDEANRSLTLISDRQSGVPFYFADLGGRIAGSFLYSDLVRYLRESDALRLVPEHLFEFLWLQRLLMDKTHDSLGRFLPSASVVTFDASGSHVQRYWRPDLSRRNQKSVRETAAEMATLMRQSMTRRMSDGKRYGLFLSGGHDSRTVLASSPIPPACFTVGYSDNFEVKCARRLAELANAPFEFLQLASNHLDVYADTAADLCGGLYSIDHALFLGQDLKVSSAADVVFHGHGIDYMYQGMYLPSRYVTLLGSPTFFRRLSPYSSDIGTQFLNEIPYRLKGVDLMSFVKPAWRERLAAHMRDSAAAVIADSKDVAQSDAERWEYFQIHALARHFSWPNIGSKMIGVEQRIPAFDVDLFDFYLSLPPEQRVTGSVLRNAQLLLNRALALVPTGNWGIPAAYSPAAKTGWLIGRKMMRHLTGNQSLRAPQAKDRTWPDRGTHLCEEPGWRRRVTDAIADEELEAELPFFDWALLRKNAQQWLEQPSAGAPLLVELLSLQLFLKRAAR